MNNINSVRGEIPQFLSISQVAKKGLLPEFALRRFAAEGKLPGIYSGRKFLVNVNRLIEQLNAVGSEPLPKM